MPLEKSASKEAFSNNVSELRHSGFPEKQSLAIAYSNQREAERHTHEDRNSMRHEHEKHRYGR